MKRDFAVVVKAVIVKEESVLVLRRSQEEMEGSFMNKQQKWDLPGGGLRFHEHAEAGLLREIKEETALHVSVGEPLSLFDVIKNHVHLCIFTYHCHWQTGEVCLSSEHESYIWMNLKEMKESDLPRWMKTDLHKALLCTKP